MDLPQRGGGRRVQIEFGKARVFSTTLGHNSETVGDPRYLDMVTRGLLWSCDKLNAEYLQPLVPAKK